MDSPNIRTRFLILSDTHGKELPEECYQYEADVAIHCGDMTDSSYITEFQTAIKRLRRLNAPLKIVIAGNHDFTLDTPTFQQKINEAGLENDPSVKSGIIFLDEGIHSLTLPNGAALNIYASPYTPSLGHTDWGFQYHPETGHDFKFNKDIDVVITHGPPKGLMDKTDHGRAGCPELFKAVARSRPRMHCFGHIHEGWGAMIAHWRDNTHNSNQPSHITAIDYGRSTIIKKLSTLDHKMSPAVIKTSHCTDDPIPLQPGSQTLFVNAAISDDGFSIHPLWQVDLELPRAV